MLLDPEGTTTAERRHWGSMTAPADDSAIEVARQSAEAAFSRPTYTYIPVAEPYEKVRLQRVPVLRAAGGCGTRSYPLPCARAHALPAAAAPRPRAGPDGARAPAAGHHRRGAQLHHGGRVPQQPGRREPAAVAAPRAAGAPEGDAEGHFGGAEERQGRRAWARGASWTAQARALV